MRALKRGCLGCSRMCNERKASSISMNVPVCLKVCHPYNPPQAKASQDPLPSFLAPPPPPSPSSSLFFSPPPGPFFHPPPSTHAPPPRRPVTLFGVFRQRGSRSGCPTTTHEPPQSSRTARQGATPSRCERHPRHSGVTPFLSSLSCVWGASKQQQHRPPTAVGGGASFSRVPQAGEASK